MRRRARCPIAGQAGLSGYSEFGDVGENIASVRCKPKELRKQTTLADGWWGQSAVPFLQKAPLVRGGPIVAEIPPELRQVRERCESVRRRADRRTASSIIRPFSSTHTAPFARLASSNRCVACSTSFAVGDMAALIASI